MPLTYEQNIWGVLYFTARAVLCKRSTPKTTNQPIKREMILKTSSNHEPINQRVPSQIATSTGINYAPAPRYINFINTRIDISYQTKGSLSGSSGLSGSCLLSRLLYLCLNRIHPTKLSFTSPHRPYAD